MKSNRSRSEVKSKTLSSPQTSEVSNAPQIDRVGADFRAISFQRARPQTSEVLFEGIEAESHAEGSPG
jgi:hypothetical protein